MSIIPQEIVSSIADLQSQIWQSVSQNVTEALGRTVSFASPLTVSARTADLYAELNAPRMIVQFAFAGSQEETQVVLIPQETVLALATELRGEDVAEIDDAVETELRPIWEAVVQGICLAAGTLRGEAIVATDLSIRFQLFTFPNNLQKSVELLRTQVAITMEGVTGAAIWLLDNDTAHSLLNMPLESGEHEEVALEIQTGGAPSTSTRDDGLGLLMDIPLEISVELGRVKMLVKEVVELGAGSVIEIDKAAGEPVDVMVNGRLVARGEVVVIEDNFGVRLTEILNPQERLARLGEVA